MNVTQNIQKFNFTIQKLINVKLFECEKDEFYIIVQVNVKKMMEVIF